MCVPPPWCGRKCSLCFDSLDVCVPSGYQAVDAEGLVAPQIDFLKLVFIHVTLANNIMHVFYWTL